MTEAIANVEGTGAQMTMDRTDEIVAGVARQCIDRGLIDEILSHLAPVLLGDGVRFFDRPGNEQIELERTNVGQSGQLTDLRFRVLKYLPGPGVGRRRHLTLAGGKFDSEAVHRDLTGIVIPGRGLGAVRMGHSGLIDRS